MTFPQMTYGEAFDFLVRMAMSNGLCAGDAYRFALDWMGL